MSKGPVLAVGAAGDFAGLVVPALVRQGARVRGLVRSEDKAHLASAAGAHEVAVGDLRDGAAMANALQGVDSVFYIAPTELGDEAAVGRAFVNAAARAGVRRFVFSSLIHPMLSAMPHHTAKLAVEDAVVESGMAFTILHPTMFFQNFARSWPQILATGVLAEPWSANTRFTRVDYRDVAEVAAMALTGNRLLNGTFELCAEGDLNRSEAAALLSDVLKRPIRPEVVAGDASRTPSTLQRMFAWYDKHDLLGNPLILGAILNRPARTLRAYFEELASGGAPRTAVLLLLVAVGLLLRRFGVLHR